VPRDRNGDFEPQLVKRYAANTNELEDKIIGMYAKGMTVRDIQGTLQELYGIDVSPTTLKCHHRQGVGTGGKLAKAAR